MFIVILVLVNVRGNVVEGDLEWNILFFKFYDYMIMLNI